MTQINDTDPWLKGYRVTDHLLKGYQVIMTDWLEQPDHWLKVTRSLTNGLSGLERVTVTDKIARANELEYTVVA